MDEHCTRVLLTLRRFIGVPLPGTALHIRGLFQAGESGIRIRLGDTHSASLTVELPTRSADGGQLLGTWWYTGAVRSIARWASENQGAMSDSAEPTTIDVAALTEAGVLPADAEVTAEDSLDYVIADLAADPLWHGAAGSAAPDLYALVGFDLRSPRVVRVYLVHDSRTIGVDLATVDSETNEPRNVGWWASTKLIALLNPDDELTLAAHQVHGVRDPACDAVYDLTKWA